METYIEMQTWGRQMSWTDLSWIYYRALIVALKLEKNKFFIVLEVYMETYTLLFLENEKEFPL